jgi:adenylate cyclase
MMEPIINIPLYNAVTLNSGYFNAYPDGDGVIRRTNLVMMGNGHPFTSLPMEMAKIVLNEKLGIEFTEDHRVQRIYFVNSKRELPVSPLGVMEINFRGPGFTFPYVSVMDVISEEENIRVTRGLASLTEEKKTDVLKDAIVLLGVSALGVFDMRAFPTDANVPGVEGHANILDNILSNDMMKHGSSTGGRVILLLLMTFGAIAFAMATQRLEAVPALLLFVFVIAGLTLADLKLLFANQQNWNTGFLYLELGAIFVMTIAVKYVLEERNKKFIKGAFARYVAPAVVDSIIKDPTKLTVGGNKKDLTIMFSDIRSFTTFSEKLDPKVLSNFLNDYLGLMTDIVFEFDGTLDKYIGDAVMAFWGSPLDQPKHALNACLAAAKMQRVLAEHRPRYKKDYDIDVNIGCGINSGPVTVGNMGSSRIFAYTVLGDHVNLASRLEGLTKYYGAGVLTTRFTFDSIQGAGEKLPPHRTLDFVKVKGKKNAVELIEVLSRDISEEGLKLFEQARQAYLRQAWDEAEALFKRSNEMNRASADEGDGPSEMYLERIGEMRKAPPGAGWDGSWEMTSK